MADPITFTTEAERLKAREQYLIITDALRYSVVSAGQAFDRTFPPIVPPKMVPFELIALVDNEGKCIELGYVYKSGAIATNVTRETRVRVTEIDDE